MDAYRILKWDSDFFGFTVALISSPEFDMTQLERVLAELRRNNVKLAYWPTTNAAEASMNRKQVTELGGRLVDEKITLLVDLASLVAPAKKVAGNDAFVEEYDSSMSNADLRALAIQSGEFSRFAVDPNIPRAKFEEMYTTWIDKSLAKDIAAEVLVIRNQSGRVVGMTTLGRKGDRGDIGLLAVDAEFRGRSFGEMLVRCAQEWFIVHGYKNLQVVTQQANTPACRLYAKCGFAIEKSEPYYHFWL